MQAHDADIDSAALHVWHADAPGPGGEVCVPLEECHFFGGVLSFVPERSVSRTDPSCSAHNWRDDAPPLFAVRRATDALVHTADRAELRLRIGAQLHTLALPPIHLRTPLAEMGDGDADHLLLPDGGALVVRFGADGVQPDYWRLDVPMDLSFGQPVHDRAEQAAVGRMLAMDAIGAPLGRRARASKKQTKTRSRSRSRSSGKKSPKRKGSPKKRGRISRTVRTTAKVVGKGTVSAAKAATFSALAKSVKAITAEVDVDADEALIGAARKRSPRRRSSRSRSRSPRRRSSRSRSPARKSSPRRRSSRSRSRSRSPPRRRSSRSRSRSASPRRRSSRSSSPQSSLRTRRRQSKSPQSSRGRSPSRRSSSRSQSPSRGSSRSQSRGSRSRGSSRGSSRSASKGRKPAGQTSARRGSRQPSKWAVNAGFIAKKGAKGLGKGATKGAIKQGAKTFKLGKYSDKARAKKAAAKKAARKDDSPSRKRRSSRKGSKDGGGGGSSKGSGGGGGIFSSMQSAGTGGGSFGGFGLGSGGGGGSGAVGPDPNSMQPPPQQQPAQQPAQMPSPQQQPPVPVDLPPAALPIAPAAPVVNVNVTQQPAVAPGQKVFYVGPGAGLAGAKTLLEEEEAMRESASSSSSPPMTPRAGDETPSSDTSSAVSSEELTKALNALINGEHYADHPAVEHIDAAIGRVAEQSPEWLDLDVYVRDVANIAACRRRN